MNRLFAGINGATARLRSDERLLVICGSTVMVMAGQGIVGPVLPLYARNFNVSAAVVGLTFTAFGLARLLLNIPAGIWADRRGRRFLLVGGPMLTAVGMIGSGLAPTIWVLLGWRFVAGAGSALYMTGAQIYLIDIAGPEERGRYIATNQGALLLGVSAGPAIGGLMADAYGLRAPFLLVGGTATLTAIYGWLRLPETLNRGTAGESVSNDLSAGNSPTDDPAIVGQSIGASSPAKPKIDLSFFRSRQFVAVGLVSMAVFAIRGSRQTLIPLYSSEEFGLSTGQIGLLFTGIGVVGLVLIAPSGWLADNVGRKPVIVFAGYVAALGVAAVAFAPTTGFFVGALMFSAMGTAIIGPAPAAFVADIAPENQRGSAMGTYRTWGDLGIVLSPPLSGALADATEIPWALLVNGALLVAAASWFLFAATDPAASDPAPGAPPSDAPLPDRT
ncbi:MAG: MFS transporter [Acidimicrobiales bacterium]